MATNLYCVADQCFVTPTAGDKATNLPKATNTNATGAGLLDSSVEGCLTTWYGGSGNVVNRTVNTTGTAVNQSYYFGRFSSLPLAAQTIPAQNWNWAMIVGEASNSANTFIWPVMYVWRPSNNTVVGYIFDASAPAGVEIAATPGTATRNFAGSAVTCLVDDILVVEAWMSGTPTAAVFAQTWRMTDKASAITSPYDILFKPQTSLWVTSATASVAPTAGTKASSLPLAQNASAAAGELVWEMTTPPNDTNQLPRTVTTLANTNPQSGFYGRWSTGPLAAQTIPVQDWGWELSGGEVNTNAKIFWWPVVYAWRPSTNAVVGYVFNATGPQGVEWYVNADPKHNQIFTGAAVTLQDGDILVLEAWAAGTQTAATSYGPTIWINSFNSKVRSPYVIQKYTAPPANASLTVTEANDSITSTTTVSWAPITANLAVIEAKDTVVSTAVAPAIADLAVTEADDTITSSATVTAIPAANASVAVTEANDTVASAGTVAWPLIETLIEDFELPLDVAKWTPTATGGTVTFSTGTSVQSITSAVFGNEATIVSKGHYTFLGSSLFWRFVQPIRSPASGIQNGMGVKTPTGGRTIQWYLDTDGALKATKQDNFTLTVFAIVEPAYYTNPTPYAWLRIRESAGTVYFDAAPITASNPPIAGDWVNKYSVATSTINGPWTDTQANFYTYMALASAGVPTQPFKVDGVNTVAGGLANLNATLGVTEAADAISSTATVVWPARNASSALTEGADVLASSASAVAGATAAITEAKDTLIATAGSAAGASSGMIEAADTITATATVAWPALNADVAVTEGNDTSSSTVSVVTPTILYFSDAVPSQAPTTGDKATYLPTGGMFRTAWTPEASWTITVPLGPEVPHNILVPIDYDGIVSGLFGRHSTGGLYAQTIPAQKWTYRPKVSAAAKLNMRYWPVIYVWRPSNSSVVGYIFDSSASMGNVWPNGQDNQEFDGAAVTVIAGDILVFEAWGVSSSQVGGGVGAGWYSESAISYIVSPYPIQFQGAPALATLTRTEADDTLASTVSTPEVATGAVTEAKDTLVATAGVLAKATAGITEAGDSIASTVGAIAGATFARTEAADTLSGAAIVLPIIAATLSVTEAPDIMAATAEVSLYGVSTANLNVTEANDTSLAYTVKPRKRAILIT